MNIGRAIAGALRLRSIDMRRTDILKREAERIAALPPRRREKHLSRRGIDRY